MGLVDSRSALLNTLHVRVLGQVDYVPVWQQMQAFTQHRGDTTADEVWLVQHSPVFTLGRNGKMEHVLAPGDIPVIPIDRGGQVTYHGPGQLVAYLLLDIRRKELGVRDLVMRIEQSIIDLLSHYGSGGKWGSGCAGGLCAGAQAGGVGLTGGKRAYLPRPKPECGDGFGAIPAYQSLWLCGLRGDAV